MKRKALFIGVNDYRDPEIRNLSCSVRDAISMHDIFEALADKDVLALVRGLSKEEARSPFPDGLFGLGPEQTNAAIRKMKFAGLISSRRDGNDHVYFLNKPRFKDLIIFLNGLIEDDPE